MSFLPRSSILLAALLSLAPGALSGPSLDIAPRHRNQAATVGKAVYFITNDQANAVVALPIGPDGKLSPGTMTPTGGAGSIALNSKGQPANPDALVSQSALTIAGNVSLPPSYPFS